MAFNFNKVIITNGISSKTVNNDYINSNTTKDGIIKNSDYKSKRVNSLLMKLSNCVKFIQDNGIMSYIKGKEYQLNSIVTVIYRDGNNNLLPTILMCIGLNDIENNVCDVVPNNNFEIDDNGNIIFIGTNWNSNYWKEIPKNTTAHSELKINDFEFKYSNNVNSRDDRQARHILIADLSKVEPEEYCYLNFNIVINRFSNVFMTCTFSGNKNNVRFMVDTVNDIKNAHQEADGSIWNQNCIFKNVALDGMFFTVDEQNAKLYLTYLGQETKLFDEFDIKCTVNKSDTNLILKEESLQKFIDNEEITIVPFTINASNVFSGNTMKIYDYAYNLSNKQQFKNGLIFIQKEDTLDRFVYPIIRKTGMTDGVWDGKIYNLNGKYRYVTSEKSRYFESKFPEITGHPCNIYIQNEPTGAFVKALEHPEVDSRPTSYTPSVQCGVNTAGKSTNKIYNDGGNWGYNKFIYKTVDPETGNYTDWKLNPTGITGENLFNSSTSEESRLTVKSGYVVPYIKLW